MGDEQILESLGKLRFLAGLSLEDRQKLAAISRFVEFPAGVEIAAEGDEPRDLHLLLGGRVELCMNVAERGRLPILTLGEGDLLGWSAALGQSEMTATSVAVKDTPTIAVSSECLHELCERDHDVGYQIMRRVAIALARRLVATRLQLLDLFGNPSTSASDLESSQS